MTYRWFFLKKERRSIILVWNDPNVVENDPWWCSDISQFITKQKEGRSNSFQLKLSNWTKVKPILIQIEVKGEQEVWGGFLLFFLIFCIVKKTLHNCHSSRRNNHDIDNLNQFEDFWEFFWAVKVLWRCTSYYKVQAPHMIGFHKFCSWQRFLRNSIKISLRRTAWASSNFLESKYLSNMKR